MCTIFQFYSCMRKTRWVFSVAFLSLGRCAGCRSAVSGILLAQLFVLSGFNPLHIKHYTSSFILCRNCAPLIVPMCGDFQREPRPNCNEKASKWFHSIRFCGTITWLGYTTMWQRITVPFAQHYLAAAAAAFLLLFLPFLPPYIASPVHDRWFYPRHTQRGTLLALHICHPQFFRVMAN